MKHLIIFFTHLKIINADLLPWCRTAMPLLTHSPLRSATDQLVKTASITFFSACGVCTKLGIVFAMDAAPALVKDDMPALNDSRRCARMALVMDEVRQAARKLNEGTNHDVRTTISDGEFYVCGGSCVQGREYSFYRQLVYAKRDADASVQRSCYPSAAALKRAGGLYVFYDSADEAVDDNNVSLKDANMMPRIAFVLKRYRRFVRELRRSGVAITSTAAADAFRRIELDMHRTAPACDLASTIVEPPTVSCGLPASTPTSRRGPARASLARHGDPTARPPLRPSGRRSGCTLAQRARP